MVSPVLDVTRAHLARHTTLRLGGTAARLLTVEDQGEIVQIARSTGGEPMLILAGGSNVVIADEGFAGTVVLLRTTGIAVEPDEDDAVRLTVQAGHVWDDVVAFTVAEGLSGMECHSGIPGSAGATPIQNVGAYGQELSEIIQRVRAYDRQRDEVLEMTPDECRFSFRHSVFKRNSRYIVLEAAVRLRRSPLSAPVRYAELARTLGVAEGARAPLGDVREAVLGLRARKGMVLDPLDPDTFSVGSFFLNPTLDAAAFADLRERALATTGREPPGFPHADGLTKSSAAWLIEQAGFGKGYTGGRGGVGISTKHTLALTNRGTGTTEELLDLAREIRAGVEKVFGVRLAPEAVLVNCAL
jgi:UDP-N-acetylmuramate dehydrogenase